jgi:hypothetical protein
MLQMLQTTEAFSSPLLHHGPKRVPHMVGSREAGTVDLNQGATALAASSRARCLNLWANWCTLVGTSLRAVGLPLLGLGLEERPRLFWCTHDDSLTWHDQDDRAPKK